VSLDVMVHDLRFVYLDYSIHLNSKPCTRFSTRQRNDIREELQQQNCYYATDSA
jgi:hypothetical protein